jgi:hydroxyacid-oxoacid transhydrogenase
VLKESAFMMDTSSIKFGPGVTSEIGYDMKNFGATRVMVVTDTWLSESETVSITMDALQKQGIDAVLFDQARIEPTDTSLKLAIEFAVDGDFDGYVAVGGGSSMDTAKAANLYATYPADFLSYVNPPIGEGRSVPGILMPLIAVPTTSGTGSETTGVVIFDLTEMHAKTGIAHRALHPSMGILDPLNTLSMPKMVTACSGLDVLCHAIESLTALPYNDRPAPDNPGKRPAYQGANPISHIWASRAIELVANYIVRVIDNPTDLEARSQMMLAATFAGIGFGNAGVTLPHGMSYPVSGMVKDYYPPDYPKDHPIVPHGMSVILNAPAVFRFTASANPDIHIYAARIMGADVSHAEPEDAGEILADTLIEIMKKVGVPNGLSAIGYSIDDIEDLVEGTLPQHRVTKLSPRPAAAEDLANLFMQSLRIW